MRNPRLFGEVNAIVSRAVKKYGFTLYEYANVGNHLHVLIRVPNLRLWGRFIREITGRIAQFVQGLKGRQKGRKFWLVKPFTRVVAGWGSAFKSIRRYVELNQLEGDGYLGRLDGKALKEMEKIWAEAFCATG